MTTTPPVPPAHPEGSLRSRVAEAIRALPFHFESKTVIEGLAAGDLFSLNSLLGGNIEVQVVKTLNSLRSVWDADGSLAQYGFVRHSQVFPDVRLVNGTDATAPPLIGIELKGWYLLSKEAVPSFRYEVTASACGPGDMIVVVPWHLSEVLSGRPVVLNPYIEDALYAAQMRNFHWLARGGTAIVSPSGVLPYPPSKSRTSDRPVSDDGGNFGRLARVPGLMDGFVRAALESEVSGIPAALWVEFFRKAVRGAAISGADQSVEVAAALEHLEVAVRLLSAD